MKLLKFLGPFWLALLAWALVIGVALGITGWVITVYYEVLPSDSITIYTDSSMTKYASSANFSGMQRGELSTIDVYIVNNTDKFIGIDQDMIETDGSFLLVTKNPPDTENVPMIINPGGSANASLTLVIKPGAQLGSHGFEVMLRPYEVDA
jgi:hypothetical protein